LIGAMKIVTDFGRQIRCDHFRYENMNLLVIMDFILFENKFIFADTPFTVSHDGIAPPSYINMELGQVSNQTIELIMFLPIYVHE